MIIGLISIIILVNVPKNKGELRKQGTSFTSIIAETPSSGLKRYWDSPSARVFGAGGWKMFFKFLTKSEIFLGSDPIALSLFFFVPSPCLSVRQAAQLVFSREDVGQ